MMDEKMKIIEEISLKYFFIVKVYTQELPAPYGKVVGLRGDYKGGRADFDPLKITNIYNMPIPYMKIRLIEELESFFNNHSQNNKSG